MPDGLVDAIKPFIDYHEEVQVRSIEYPLLTQRPSQNKKGKTPKMIAYFEMCAFDPCLFISQRSKVLRHHFYLLKVIIQVQTDLEYLAG